MSLLMKIERAKYIIWAADMQRAVGEKLFALPQFAQWAKKIANVMIFDMWQKPAAAKVK